MMYGLHHSQSVLLTDISRLLEISIKLCNTVERLSDHLLSFSDASLEKVKENYYRKVINYTDTQFLILLDDSEIIKKHGKKFEDLCRGRDASSLKNNTYP